MSVRVSLAVQTLTVAAQNRLRERILAVLSLCLGIALTPVERSTNHKTTELSV